MRGYGYSYGPAMMGGYSPWSDLLILLFWLFILVGVVILIVWAIQQTARHGTASIPPVGNLPVPPQDEAMAVARKRLAAGEITCEQFDEIRKALGG